MARRYERRDHRRDGRGGPRAGRPLKRKTGARRLTAPSIRDVTFVPSSDVHVAMGPLPWEAGQFEQLLARESAKIAVDYLAYLGGWQVALDPGSIRYGRAHWRGTPTYACAART
jgi:hypothetical protein